MQTEDKGLDSPIILSLVYSGGAILASKRSPYKDLIASGLTDEALSDRLKRQHRLICAAIRSGRLNELKKMSGRDLETAAGEGVGLSVPLDAPIEGTGVEQPVGPDIPATEPAEGHPPAEDEVYSVHDPRRKRQKRS